MRVREGDEAADAIRLGHRIGIRDDDVLAAGRGDALVHVRGEAESTLVLYYAHVVRQVRRPAARSVRHDDELVDLRVQCRQGGAEQLGLPRAGHDEDTGDLHAASTVR